MKRKSQGFLPLRPSFALAAEGVLYNADFRTREVPMRTFHPFVLSALMALPISETAQADVGQITVTGEASIIASPDIAIVSLGVITTGDNAVAAMAANAAEMTKVIERLKASGIADTDLQTSNLQLYPNQPRASKSLSGQEGDFTAANQLQLRVRALDQLGAILDGAISDGANSLQGVSFDLAQPRGLQDEARAAAVADAAAKAKILAEAAGVKLGKITAITDGGNLGGGVASYRMTSAKIPVEAGQITISQSVSVSFEIAE